MPDWVLEIIKLIGTFASGGLLVAILRRKWEKEDKSADFLGEIEKVNKKIDDFKALFMTELEKDRKKSAEYRAKQSRARILSFNDELMRKVQHTKESFDDVIAEIDRYDDYCLQHPEFPNFKAVAAIENVKATYKLCLKDGSFLK